jgi:outer membrane protein
MAAAGPLSAQQPSIVYLDSERLRQEAPSLQAARQQMQAEMAQLEAKADSALAPLQQELQQMAVEFQQQQGMMNAETRQRQQTAIQQKQAELQQAGSQWEQRAAQRQNEILGPALSHINDVIDQLRQEKGYTFILDAAAGSVVAADPALDITSEVLARLSASAQGS